MWSERPSVAELLMLLPRFTCRRTLNAAALDYQVRPRQPTLSPSSHNSFLMCQHANKIGELMRAARMRRPGP